MRLDHGSGQQAWLSGLDAAGCGLQAGSCYSWASSAVDTEPATAGRTVGKVFAAGCEVAEAALKPRAHSFTPILVPTWGVAGTGRHGEEQTAGFFSP